jgi:hypothetical protein
MTGKAFLGSIPSNTETGIIRVKILTAGLDVKAVVMAGKRRSAG